MAGHNKLGKWGEDIACDELVRLGATILERNWRSGRLEVDIIAALGDTIVFVEVKTRADFEGDPLEAVDKRKISHMVRAADAYLRGCTVPYFARFDLFAVRGTPENFEIEHVPDAFYPPLKSYR
ncbi:MAG: YraN family protein [Muribaculaceae bacterium]|nr:YraN family protein [Muribaculaceae bacterium]MDE6134741.1 YraN family protein [Muribaculaceae bacterium]